jgi:mannose-6-phosphate isomerase-like protein (cupin superfamily)
MLRTAFALAPNEGETFDAGPFHIVTRIHGGESAQGFELYDLTIGPATVDYHVHQKMDETLCVVEGEVEFNLAGQSFRRPAGSVAFVPRGVHHGFTNHGPQRARVLITFSPAQSQDEYFRQLEKLFAAATLDTAALADLQRRYDQQLVVPEACSV